MRRRVYDGDEAVREVQDAVARGGDAYAACAAPHDVLPSRDTLLLFYARVRKHAS